MNASVFLPGALTLLICQECRTPLLMINGVAQGIVDIDITSMAITPHDSMCSRKPKPLGYGVYPT